MANRVKSELTIDAAKTIANLQKLTDTLNQTASTLNKTASSFSNIKKAIDNNTNVLNKTAQLYKAANKEFKDTGKELKNVNEKTKETTNNQKKLGKQSKEAATGMAAAFGKVGVAVSATIGTLKSMLSTIGNLAKKIEEMVKPQAEYIEDLNFLDNAYGKANNSGKQLLDTLNRMVGYDPATLIKSTAIFRQMGNALDLDAEVADKLANNLTKLTVDVKSITGQDLEKVASKFQSAMAGNIRAVRAYGVDVTQAALQQEALRLGIDRQISSFSRAEKSILTYIAMERQLSTANGDLSRTVNSVGNQWEIFRNQIAELGRLIGGFFIPILKAILPVLNGIIMALNTIISMVMSFFGIDAESFSQEFGNVSSGVDDLTDSFDDMAQSASGAGKAAKEAQKSLRGFDKLNNITTPTSGSKGGGGGASGSIGGIDPKLLSFLDDYNLHLEEMNNWATKIRDKIMEWLGFTKIVDEVTGEVTYKFGGFHRLLQNLDSSPIAEVLKYLNFVLYGPLTLLPIKLTEVLIRNDEVWDGFKKNIQGTFKAIEPIFKYFTDKIIPALGKAFKWLHENIIKPFSDFLDRIFADIWLDVIMPAWDRINKEILPPLTELIKNLWENVLVPLGNFLGTILKPIFDTLISTLEWLWKNILKPIVNFIINNVITMIRNNIEKINLLITVIGWLIGKFGELWEKVRPVVDNITSKIGELKNKFDEKLKPIKDIIDKIKQAFESLQKTIRNFDIGKAVSGLGKSVGNFFGGLFGKADGGIWNNGMWSPVKAYAGGGFPSRGEIFMARETKGPELVGRIGSSTAVLNNDQILEQMTLAVARGIAASGDKERPVNIIAEGNAGDLLQFINFKNASKNRQFGL